MNGVVDINSRSLDQWLEYIQEQHDKEIDMGLDRMFEMVERLDLNPITPKVVTVAGTNGKGSTCITIEQLLLSHGLKVGTTLSPHVFRFNERIRLQGGELSDQEICGHFETIELARDGLPLTYFEFSSLAALVAFSQCDLDVVILEIGLGGRLDAFNAIDADIAVVTSIGFDHQEFLGESLEEIGKEKAGIFRPGQKVVLGADMPRTVYEASKALGCEESAMGKNFRYLEGKGSSWSYFSEDLNMEAIPRGSLSAHNLSLALEVTRELVDIDPSIVIQTLPVISLQGRMTELLLDGHNYVFDVCHNSQGAEFFVRELKLRGIEPDFIICGMFRNKDHQQVFREVSRNIDAEWILIDTLGVRGFRSKELRDAFGGNGMCLPGFNDARAYIKIKSSNPSTVLAFGSFNVLEQACESMNVQRIS